MGKKKGQHPKRHEIVKKDQPKSQKAFQTIEKKIVAQQFHGPIPPPAILLEYDQIVAGSADRIISLAEKETAHRHIMEEKAINAEIRGLQNEAIDARIGQIFGLIIGLATIAAGTYCSINKAPISGALIGTSGVVGLVSAFIIGRKASPSKDIEVKSPKK